MKKATIVWLVVAAALVLVGVIVFVMVMSINNWELNALTTVKYETREYVIDEDFTDILIDTDTSHIMFVPSADGKCRVVVCENAKAKHNVSVVGDSLDIRLEDTRKWHDRIGIFQTEGPKITVYIPSGEYGNLKIKSSTGAVDLRNQFKFESSDITVSTGAVVYSASTSDKVRIHSTTGNVTVADITARDIDIKVSTGKVSLSNSTFADEVNITVSTGKAEVIGVKCKSLISEGDTGKLSMTNVIATDKFNIERDTGDVVLEACDAAEIYIETNTGDVEGSFLTDKVVFATTDTGKIEIPKTNTGGRCEVKTDTGDIEIEIKK